MNDVKTALLVVDMQNAYFEDEPLRSVQTVLTEKCNGLITAALAHSVPVINVRTEHRHDKSTWTLNMLESNKGFVLSGTAETKILPDLHIEGSLEIIKTRDSSFVGLQHRLSCVGYQPIPASQQRRLTPMRGMLT